MFERSFVPSGDPTADSTRGGTVTWWGPMVAFAQTIGRFLSRPERTFRGFRRHGGFGLPLLFVTLVGGVGLAVRVSIEPLVGSTHVGPMGPSRQGLVPLFWMVFWAFPAIYVYLRAHILHLVLVLTRRVQESFEVTFRVTAYANGAPALFLVLPFVGETLFLVLGLWIEVTGLRRCQRLTFAEALVTELIPPVFLVLTVLAVLAARFFVGSPTSA